MSRSFDGGKQWEKPQPVAGPVTQPGVIEVRGGLSGDRRVASGARSRQHRRPAPGAAAGLPGDVWKLGHLVLHHGSVGAAVKNEERPG
jgi:hypothetical protein